MLVEIHPDNPDPRKIRAIVEILRNDGIIVYPTDSVYALGCDLNSKTAVERLAKIKGLDISKAMFSMLCLNISQISEYSKQISNDKFRILKRNLPGPFTFILQAGNRLPKTLYNRKETIGVRISQNKIASAIIEELGNPLLSSSLYKVEDDIQEYYTEAWEIQNDLEKRVEAIIDGGTGNLTPSALVDLTQEEPMILRPGAKELL
jgi:tRNA threonylcarbamoyl adenosine modification protein (Sua5/YciO/YrdC/YwlC family)